MKRALLFSSFLIFNSFFISICAQSIKTDYGVYPPPAPPALPASGGTFTDPTFGTKLLRVTDSNDGSDNHQSYSYWPSMNRNSSLLYISSVGGSPALYDFDTAALAVSNKRAMFQSNPPGGGAPSAEDAIWSGKQNNVMLCHTAQKIWSYNVSTNTYSLIKDFSSAYPNLYLTQMSRSISDSVFAFTYRENVNYNNIGYIIYRVQGNITDTANLAGLDEVQIDKAGKYLVIKTGNSGPGVIEVKILNVQTKAEVDLTDNAPDFSPGHSDNGTGFVIGADNWNNTYTYRTFTNPHTHYAAFDFGNDWSQGNHVSMQSDDENWMLMSTFTSNTLPSSGIFADEIFQFSTDGNKNVRRLAHTHSDVLNQTPPNDYWSSPRANISRDGKFVTFTSNWGSTTRRDVFVLKIPATTVVGISEEQTASFDLFPNPSSGQLIVTGLKCPAMIEIYNMVGEKILEKTYEEGLSIDLNIPNGLYFVKISKAEGTTTRKLVITR